MSADLATLHPAPGDAAPGGVGTTRARLVARELTVVDHVEATLERIRTRDPGLGAFLAVAGDDALREAEAADARIRSLGAAAWDEQPLLGITVSVKDLIQTRDLPTTRGSLLRNPRRQVDAPAVARLRAAGAVVVGKTTTSEYGWSASTVSRVAPATRNPWNPALTAGGSSGGAAAAVAAGLCDVSLGTDGAGSIRIPSAFCGVVGYKPSFGQVPYVPSGADRLAHLGPISADVADAAELAAVIAGPHLGDPDSALVARDAPRRHRSLRIGWIEYPDTAEEVRRTSERAFAALVDRGHRVERHEVGCTDLYPVLVDLIAASEAAGTAPGDEELCDPGRLAVVRHGRTLSAADVIRAEEARHLLRAQLQQVMDGYDLLVSATVPIEPFTAEAVGPAWAADPADLLWIAWAPACFPFNMTGQPALSLPAGLTPAGLPVGVQLVGPFGADALVLATALRLEKDLGRLPAPPFGAVPSPRPH